MSANSLVVSSLLSLLSTVSSTTTSYVLHIVRHVESIKNFMSAPITTAYDILVEEKFNQSDTSCQTCQRPPWSSPPSYPPRPRCRWPPTHMYLWSLMLSWKHRKTLMSPSITTAYHVLVEHIQTQVIHPIVSVLPGLLLQVVLTVHGVVEHQLSCT